MLWPWTVAGAQLHPRCGPDAQWTHGSPSALMARCLVRWWPCKPSSPLVPPPSGCAARPPSPTQLRIVMQRGHADMQPMHGLVLAHCVVTARPMCCLHLRLRLRLRLCVEASWRHQSCCSAPVPAAPEPVHPVAVERRGPTGGRGRDTQCSETRDRRRRH